MSTGVLFIISSPCVCSRNGFYRSHFLLSPPHCVYVYVCMYPHTCHVRARALIYFASFLAPCSMHITHTHTYIYYVHTYIHTYTHIHTYNTHTCTYTHNIHIHTLRHAHMYAHTHTHMHTHAHTYMYSGTPL